MASKVRVESLLKIFFSAKPSYWESAAMRQDTIDNITSSRELGFRPVLFGGPIVKPRHYATLLSSWRVANVFLAPYPHFFRYGHVSPNPFRDIDMFLLDLLTYRNKRTRSILFVLDLPIDQELAENKRTIVDSKSYEVEKKVLRIFDILCVFNEKMKSTLSERYGISDDKFVMFGIKDCRSRPFQIPLRKVPDLRWRIVSVGHGERFYAGEWADNLPQSERVSYEFIGADWDWVDEIGRRDLTWKPFMNQQELVDYISEHAHFGIVAYSEKLSEYTAYGCPSKFSTYMAAGIPVIVTSNCKYVSFVVRKFGLGFSVDSFDELPTLLQHLSQSDYEGMRRRCLGLAEKMWSGYFFKRAVIEAMRRVHGTPNT